MLFEAFKKMREERPMSAAFLVTSGDLALPITWRQFTDDIDIVVHLIRTYAPGAKVGILGENSYEWMVAHAAILFSGAVAIPVDMNLTPQEVSELMKKLTGRNYPVFVDNMESVDDLANVKPTGQVIMAKCVNGAALTVRPVKPILTQMEQAA